jgi:hypothetical protein
MKEGILSDCELPIHTTNSDILGVLDGFIEE